MKKGNGILSGLIWRFSERIAAQIVTFTVSVILARLLAPSDYGLISMITVFITLSNVLVTSGLGNALIQKKYADSLDFSSVFFAQLTLAFLMYGVLFLCAPWITSFYGQEYEILTDVLRVLGLTIPLRAINNVQHSYVSRKMIFKKYFIATLSGTGASAVVGIYMAYTGWGVWALVGQQLSNLLVNTCVLYAVIDWRPRLAFSFTRLKPLFQYGWKIFTVDIVNTLLNNLRTMIVGKYYTAEDLAYYNKAEQFPSLIVTNINSSIQSVLFPAMANVQHEPEKVKTLLRRMISIGSFVIFPLVYGFLAVAGPVVRLLLTEKWMACVPFVQIFCVSYSLRIISTSCAQSVKAMGRSDIYLKSSTVYKTLELISILVTALIGVKAIAVGTAMNAAILVMINFYCNRQLLGYRVRELAVDLLPNMLLSAVMVAVVILVGTVLKSPWMLAVQILVGAAVYIGGALLLRLKPMYQVLDILKRLLHKGS